MWKYGNFSEFLHVVTGNFSRHYMLAEILHVEIHCSACISTCGNIMSENRVFSHALLCQKMVEINTPANLLLTNINILHLSSFCVLFNGNTC